jgi:hypothetical protein
MALNAMDVPKGFHAVLRPGRDSGAGRITRHTSGGHDFQQSGKTRGYGMVSTVQDEDLALMNLPRAWYRVWHALLALNSRGSRYGAGYVEVTYDKLTERFGIPNGHISPAMTFFTSQLWLRRVRNGVLQLNPYLAFRGTSGEQQDAIEEWLAATGGVPFLTARPASGTVKAWRAARAARRLGETAPPPARPALSLVSTSTPRPAPGSAERPVVQPLTSDPDVRLQLLALRSSSARARRAAELIGPGATLGRVQELLRLHGFDEEKETIKSALQRHRKRQQL